MTGEVHMKDEVEAYLERPKRYENVDGTPEMFVGLMFLGFALAIPLEGLLPKTSPRWAHLVTLLVIAEAVSLLGFPLRRFIKKRWTWRRTGYVAYRRDARWWVVLAVSSLVAAAIPLVVVLVKRHAGVTPSQAGQWAVVPAGYAFLIFFRSREHLWKWLLFLIMVAGLLALGLPVHGDYERVGWQLLLFLGLVWIGSGAGTLFSYIRHTQLPESQAQ